MLALRLATALVLLVAAPSMAHAQSAGLVTVKNRGGASSIDYANAEPRTPPVNLKAPGSQLELLRRGENARLDGEAGFEPGGRGDGSRTPVKLPKSQIAPSGPGGVSPQEFGAANQPYTTSVENNPDVDPYRRAGKLFFKIGKKTFVCSASLIKRGVVVTAAHCVSDFGKGRIFTDFEYVPAYSGGDAPFGVWGWERVIAPMAYLDGSDPCAVKGVVCESDVAVVVLAPQDGRYAGQSTGFFGFAFGGYSYTPNKQALITQLGYPFALNGGEEMMRTDSQGAVDPSLSGNTVIGSLQTGGSSGGPWLVNFGAAPVLQGEPFGSDAGHNVVVGATSWGFTDGVTKQQGASFFTKQNIKALVSEACTAAKPACK